MIWSPDRARAGGADAGRDGVLDVGGLEREAPGAILEEGSCAKPLVRCDIDGGVGSVSNRMLAVESLLSVIERDIPEIEVHLGAERC
jgi:hypothetical protein